MSTKERLLIFIKHIGLTPSRFEKSIGVSNGYVNNIRKSISESALKKIEEKYPELNKLWLIMNEGPMLKPDANDTTKTEAEIPDPPIAGKQVDLMQIISNLSYQGKKNADSIEKMAATNERNSQLMAAMFAEMFPNSKIAAQLIVSPDDLQKTDATPVEAFLTQETGGTGDDPGSTKGNNDEGTGR